MDARLLAIGSSRTTTAPPAKPRVTRTPAVLTDVSDGGLSYARGHRNPKD